ncbi:MAG TPA: aminotransferase class III-fold pyridoxal phosphate-dependent enzyme [Bryobacteraceae bacterium]|nr:aminotransferase class III-fold pyridoxal phosphate-dependent enzyme [Bryobacteraceae bacterium]
MKLTERQERLLNRTFVDYRSTSDFVENPLVINRAEGLYCWDTEGKRYFDAIGGIFVAILGHRHPRVMEAMRLQMERLTFVGPMHGISDITLDFVERVGSVTPDGLNFVKALSGGSEAVESAMKFVRQYHKQAGFPGKYKFVSRYYGYHGGTFGAMAASGNGVRKSKFEPHMTGFPKVFPPSYYRDSFPTWEEANRFAAKCFEDVIIHEDPDTVAAVMVEPIGNTGGIITPTEEYFQILRRICDQYNVTLIFDEVITGFAKTGRMFAAQTYGVTPDVICTGKGISAGAIPLGAMIAREDMANAFTGPRANDHFAHGHTYSGNPLACAVGIAVIDEIIEQNLCAKAERLGQYIASRLDGLKKLGVVREIRGKGVLLGVELTNARLGAILKKTALKHGIIMRIDPSWFAVSPPLIAQESDIDEMCALIEKSLTEAIELEARG